MARKNYLKRKLIKSKKEGGQNKSIIIIYWFKKLDRLLKKRPETEEIKVNIEKSRDVLIEKIVNCATSETNHKTGDLLLDARLDLLVNYKLNENSASASVIKDTLKIHLK